LGAHPAKLDRTYSSSDIFLFGRHFPQKLLGAECGVGFASRISARYEDIPIPIDHYKPVSPEVRPIREQHNIPFA